MLRVPARAWRGAAIAARGAATAVQARPVFFVAVTLGALSLHILLPPLVLSIARKPWDYFTVNAWLPGLPDYLVSDPAPIAEKAAKLRRLALFWFSADNPYGTEWGFAVDVGDLARMTFASLLIATYFALWRYRHEIVNRRSRLVPVDRGRRRGLPTPDTTRGVGLVGALASVLGLTVGPCSVMGCGAPVIPVVGLAFAGLSSTTLHALRDLSTGATAVVLVGLTLGVGYLGWITGAGRTGPRPTL
jgi:hypothetical protein